MRFLSTGKHRRALGRKGMPFDVPDGDAVSQRALLKAGMATVDEAAYQELDPTHGVVPAREAAAAGHAHKVPPPAPQSKAAESKPAGQQQKPAQKPKAAEKK